MMDKIIRYLAVSFVLVLTACGGGGGGGSSTSSPTPSTLAFPLKQAVTAMNASGFNVNFSGTIVGSAATCKVSLTISETPATTATTFEGKAALAATATGNISYSACTNGVSIPSSSNVTTYYFDTNYVDLGANSSSSFFDYVSTPNYPATVRVGDIGTIGTQIKYVDSTKATTTGSAVITYSIESDTATTAIVNVVTKNYDASNTLENTGQGRYRITSAGAMTYISYTSSSAISPTVLSLTAQ